MSAPKKDILQELLERLIKKLLREAKNEPFEQKINALKIAVFWFANSRKLAPAKSDAGALLEEMRKMVEEGVEPPK